MIKFKKLNLPKQNWKVGVIKTYRGFVCASFKTLSASKNEKLIPNKRPAPFENFSKTGPPLIPGKTPGDPQKIMTIHRT